MLILLKVEMKSIMLNVVAFLDLTCKYYIEKKNGKL